MIRCGEVHSLDVPPGIQEYITNLGGLSLDGQPLYRVAWVNSLVKATARDYPHYPGLVVGRSRHRKYGRSIIHDRFVIERLRPASEYGDPRDWIEGAYSKTSGTYIDYGPFPSRGVYSLVDTVEDSLSQFMFPTRSYVHTVLVASSNRDMMTPEAEREMIDNLAAAEERATDERRLDMIRDASKPSDAHGLWVSMNTTGKRV